MDAMHGFLDEVKKGELPGVQQFARMSGRLMSIYVDTVKDLENNLEEMRKERDRILKEKDELEQECVNEISILRKQLEEQKECKRCVKFMNFLKPMNKLMEPDKVAESQRIWDDRDTDEEPEEKGGIVRRTRRAARNPIIVSEDSQETEQNTNTNNTIKKPSGRSPGETSQNSDRLSLSRKSNKRTREGSPVAKRSKPGTVSSARECKKRVGFCLDEETQNRRESTSKILAPDTMDYSYTRDRRARAALRHDGPDVIPETMAANLTCDTDNNDDVSNAVKDADVTDDDDDVSDAQKIDDIATPDVTTEETNYSMPTRIDTCADSLAPYDISQPAHTSTPARAVRKRRTARLTNPVYTEYSDSEYDSPAGDGEEEEEGGEMSVALIPTQDKQKTRKKQPQEIHVISSPSQSPASSPVKRFVVDRPGLEDLPDEEEEEEGDHPEPESLFHKPTVDLRVKRNMSTVSEPSPSVITGKTISLTTADAKEPTRDSQGRRKAGKLNRSPKSQDPGVRKAKKGVGKGSQGKEKRGKGGGNSQRAGLRNSEDSKWLSSNSIDIDSQNDFQDPTPSRKMKQATMTQCITFSKTRKPAPVKTDTDDQLQRALLESMKTAEKEQATIMSEIQRSQSSPRSDTASHRRKSPDTASHRRKSPDTASHRRKSPGTATNRRKSPDTATNRRRSPTSFKKPATPVKKAPSTPKRNKCSSQLTAEGASRRSPRLKRGASGGGDTQSYPLQSYPLQSYPLNSLPPDMTTYTAPHEPNGSVIDGVMSQFDNSHLEGDTEGARAPESFHQYQEPISVLEEEMEDAGSHGNTDDVDDDDDDILGSTPDAKPSRVPLFAGRAPGSQRSQKHVVTPGNHGNVTTPGNHGNVTTPGNHGNISDVDATRLETPTDAGVIGRTVSSTFSNTSLDALCYNEEEEEEEEEGCEDDDSMQSAVFTTKCQSARSAAKDIKAEPGTTTVGSTGASSTGVSSTGVSSTAAKTTKQEKFIDGVENLNPDTDVKPEINDSMERYEKLYEKEGPGYVYQEVVRKKNERKHLKAQACGQCWEYFESFTHLSEQERLEKLKACRHKYTEIPPSTPEHFWDPGFPDTQEAEERGISKSTQAQPSRFRRRVPLKLPDDNKQKNSSG